MRLSPFIYHKIVRPKFAIKKYILNVIKEEFDFENKKVLDFGCGTGSNSFIFDSSHYLGVDINKERIAYAQKLFPGYSFKAIKGEVIPAKDHSFDFICIFATLHHIPNKIFLSCIKEFSRILKPRGRIVMIEPCLFPHSKFNDWFMNFFDEGKYIRHQEEYLRLFNNKFKVTVYKKFRILFYNELFFSAEKR